LAKHETLPEAVAGQLDKGTRCGSRRPPAVNQLKKHFRGPSARRHQRGQRVSGSGKSSLALPSVYAEGQTPPMWKRFRRMRGSFWMRIGAWKNRMADENFRHCDRRAISQKTKFHTQPALPW